MTAFRHEAVLYDGQEAFVHRMSSFVREGLEGGEPVLVMVTWDKVELLRSELGPDARDVSFRDMRELGRNPARIIPAWEEFFAGRTGPARGIGEPIWAGRSAAELVESQRHEALINLAFSGMEGWLVCPYDVATLGPDVIDEAHRSHPVIMHDGSSRASADYDERVPGTFDAPLPHPESEPETLPFGGDGLGEVRRLVAARAESFGLTRDRSAEAVLAVSEVASNSLRHGGGGGTLRLWTEGDTLLVDVLDAGRIDQPLVGRRRPDLSAEGGFGLWLVNQLADLCQVRSFTSGSVVRLHFVRIATAQSA